MDPLTMDAVLSAVAAGGASYYYRTQGSLSSSLMIGLVAGVASAIAVALAEYLNTAKGADVQFDLKKIGVRAGIVLAVVGAADLAFVQSKVSDSAQIRVAVDAAAGAVAGYFAKQIEAAVGL